MTQYIRIARDTIINIPTSHKVTLSMGRALVITGLSWTLTLCLPWR